MKIFDRYYLHNFKCFMKHNGTAIYIPKKNKKLKMKRRLK